MLMQGISMFKDGTWKKTNGIIYGIDWIANITILAYLGSYFGTEEHEMDISGSSFLLSSSIGL